MRVTHPNPPLICPMIFIGERSSKLERDPKISSLASLVSLTRSVPHNFLWLLSCLQNSPCSVTSSLLFIFGPDMNDGFSWCKMLAVRLRVPEVGVVHSRIWFQASSGDSGSAALESAFHFLFVIVIDPAALLVVQVEL